MPHTFNRWSMTLFAWRRSRVLSLSFQRRNIFVRQWFSLSRTLTEQEDGHQSGGQPLFTYMTREILPVTRVSSPLLPTICYRRLIKMLTNTRDPSCLKRILVFGQNRASLFRVWEFTLTSALHFLNKTRADDQFPLNILLFSVPPPPKHKNYVDFPFPRSLWWIFHLGAEVYSGFFTPKFLFPKSLANKFWG